MGHRSRPGSVPQLEAAARGGLIGVAMNIGDVSSLFGGISAIRTGKNSVFPISCMRARTLGAEFLAAREISNDADWPFRASYCRVVRTCIRIQNTAVES